MIPKNSVNKSSILMNSITAILDALASQQHGETSLIVTIQPDLIEEAMNALVSYRTLFAPFIPGVTETAPIHAIYERMLQAGPAQESILLLVECQTMDQFREALGRLPIRKSSDWRAFDDADFWERYFNGH